MATIYGVSPIWAATTDEGRTLVSTRGVVQSGLVVNWDAGSTQSYPGSGTTWTDLSGNNQHGTLFNGPTYSGSNGGNIVFDGSNDYVFRGSLTSSVAWTPSGASSLSTNNITLEMWIRTTDADAAGDMISKPWNNGGSYNYRWLHQAGATGIFQASVASELYNLTVPSVRDGKWHHMALWISPTQIGYYLDAPMSSSSANHGITSNSPSNGNFGLTLMSVFPYGDGWSGDAGLSSSGQVASFRVYNRVLSTDEVIRNFNATRGRFGV